MIDLDLSSLFLYSFALYFSPDSIYSFVSVIDAYVPHQFLLAATFLFPIL